MRFGLLLSLFLIGCANATNKCGDKVQLLWPDSEGEYKFQDVQLTTLKSPYELKGAAAEIYFESGFGENGFEGPVAQPRLMRADGVCVPEDAGSSVAIAAYAIMERLWNYEQTLGTAGQISWPRKVGVEFHLRGDPIDTHNNAHYYGKPDAMAVVPYNRADLPVALNHGILAHEHFHSHFQSQVNNLILEAIDQVVSLEDLFYPREFRFKPTVDDLRTDVRSARGVNNFILRGWNEGLADFFAAVYSGRPDFFAASLPSARDVRRLDLPLGQLATAEVFTEVADAAVERRGLAAAEQTLVGLAYGQGALIARAFYRISLSGFLPPEEVLAHVMKRLSEIPKTTIPTYASRVVEPDQIFPLLLSGLPLNETACAHMRLVLQKNTLQKGLSQCVGL